MASTWKYRNPIRIGFQILILALLGYVALRPLFGGGYVSDFESVLSVRRALVPDELLQHRQHVLHDE